MTKPRDKKGRFVKGHRYSPKTQFKKGEHWRDKKPFWNKEWLKREYHGKDRSANNIAKEFNVTESAILYWLRKLDIPRKKMTDIRNRKHWGAEGRENGMYGRTGKKSPNWKGGATPERQAFYSSQEWIEAVKKVWKRDRAICRKCGKEKKVDDEFHIHHKVSFANESLRADLDNLVLLCKDCHNWVHGRKNKNKEFIKND